MIFRQFFHAESYTYTYLLAGRAGGEALLIDPVLDCVERYLRLLDELGLRLSRRSTPMSTPITSPASASCATGPGASP